jgi:hypothetical protein
VWLTLGVIGIAVAYYVLRSRSDDRGQLAPAVIGLLGVLIGGAITSGITYLGDRNRRHDEQRAAARLVIAEILDDTPTLFQLGQPGGLIPSHRPLAATAWHDEQGTLAKYLSDDQWDKVARFYLYIGRTDAALANPNCRKHRSLGEALYGFDSAHDALVSLGAHLLTSRVPRQVLKNARVCLF